MWKYVQRRVRDTWQRTYNAVEHRKATWNASEDDEQKSSRGSKVTHAGPCFLTFAGSRTSSSSSKEESYHGKKKSDQYNYCNPDQFQAHAWISALTLSGAIAFGWYASKSLCLHNRHHWRLQACSYRVLFEQPNRAFHSSVVNRANEGCAGVWRAEGPPPKEWKSRPSYKLKYGFKQPTVLIEDDEGEEFISEKFLLNVNNEKETIKEEPPETPTPPEHAPNHTVDTVVNELLSSLGEIEFALAMQKIANSEFGLAVTHLKQATTHKHTSATFNLAVCYQEGLGVKKDLRMAKDCYEAAAAAGHPKAMYNLGIFYLRGLGGLEKSILAAQKCFIGAARLGVREAQDALNMQDPLWRKTKTDFAPNYDAMNKVEIVY